MAEMVIVAPPARWYAWGASERCDTCSVVSKCGVAWWCGWPHLIGSFVGFDCFACIKSRATDDPRDSWDTDRDGYWTEVVGVEFIQLSVFGSYYNVMYQCRDAS